MTILKRSDLMVKKIWLIIFFIALNIGTGMPVLFLYISVIFEKKWLLIIIPLVLIWFFGNLYLLMGKSTIAKLMYFLIAVVIVFISAFTFFKPLFW